MASTVVTHSKKKKSVFPSIGSRHRLPVAQGFTDRFEGILPLPFIDLPSTFLTHRAAPGMSSIRGGARANSPHVAPLFHKDSVDDMASALLESTVEERPLSTPLSAKVRMLFLVDHLGRALILALQMLPFPAPLSGDGFKNPHDVARRPLPKSHTFLNPLARNPPKLPASATVHLGGGGLAGQHSPAGADQNRPTDPDDINRKVEEMLAATEALKPAPVENHRQSAVGGLPSVMNRLKTAKVFSKVSNAFHHRSLGIQLKPKTCGARSVTPADDEPAVKPVDVPAPALPSFPEPPPIASMELRLNEGHNLNRKKVRQITGGHVPRKPVPTESEVTCALQTRDDPFSESGGTTRTPTPFECRLRDSYRSVESYMLPLLRSDPFVTEKILEGSVNSILHSPPLSSSTPRVRNRHVRCISDTPAKKSSRKVNSVAGPGPARPNSVSSLAAKGRRSSSSVTDLGLPNGERMVRSLSKKHPSPSKARLEVFSKQLENYPNLLARPAHLPFSPEVKIKKHQSPTKHQLATLSQHMTAHKLLAENENPKRSNENIQPSRPSAANGSCGSQGQHFERLSSIPMPNDGARLSPFMRQKIQPAHTASTATALGEGARSSSPFLRRPVYESSPKPSKKHPTPSLEDLEALDRQFRQFQLKEGAVLEDVDELADSFYNGLPGSKTVNVLGIRDTNRAGLRHSAREPTAEWKNRQRSAMPKVRTYSRLPICTEQVTRSRTEMRLAGPFRPTNGNAMDLDELQWDSSPYLIRGNIAEVH